MGLLVGHELERLEFMTGNGGVVVLSRVLCVLNPLLIRVVVEVRDPDAGMEVGELRFPVVDCAKVVDSPEVPTPTVCPPGVPVGAPGPNVELVTGKGGTDVSGDIFDVPLGPVLRSEGPRLGTSVADE
jgi:hypothetical protein